MDQEPPQKWLCVISAIIIEFGFSVEVDFTENNLINRFAFCFKKKNKKIIMSSKCVIKFDNNPEGIYESGELLTGAVELTTVKVKVIRGAWVVFINNVLT